jgi:uncharacterized protein (TIGR03435 family)
MGGFGVIRIMRIRIGLLLCLAAGVTFAADSRPSFDAASVKADQSDTGVDHVRNAGGTFLTENVSLRRYIAMAYGLPESREYLLSGPEWLDSERFDISARYPAQTSNADSLLMLQRLLEERFGLKVHHETRDFAAYALVAGKNGPKLKAAVPPTDAQTFPCGNPPGGFRVRDGHALGCSIPMSALADRLSRQPFGLDRPVIDLTGLSGEFDVTLNFSDESIITAVQDQLGLKLELRKIPVDVLVVDHADKVPAAN